MESGTRLATQPVTGIVTPSQPWYTIIKIKMHHKHNLF